MNSKLTGGIKAIRSQDTKTRNHLIKEIGRSCHSALDAESIFLYWIPAYAGMTKGRGYDIVIGE